MSPINPKLICGVWCALALIAAGQDAVPNAGDRLEAETAARLREFEKNHRRGDPKRPMSPEMQAISRNPDRLYNLGAGDLEKMSLDDPLLKYAYARVFMDSMGPFEQLESPMELVLADMRRRGEAVSPMLLKLIEENRETRIESSILGKIDHLETVQLEPFLEYARKLLRERTQSGVVAVASGLLARRGTEEDMKLFEWVLTQEPWAITDLTGNQEILRDRLNPRQLESRPERRERPSSNAGIDIRPAPGASVPSQDENSIRPSRAKPWVIGGLILVVLLGGWRVLSKRCRGLPG